MKTNKQITWEQFLRQASGHFLVNKLPEEFLEWEEERIDEFIHKNRTCWFRNCEPNELYEIIEALANEMQFLHENGSFEFD